MPPHPAYHAIAMSPVNSVSMSASECECERVSDNEYEREGNCACEYKCECHRGCGCEPTLVAFFAEDKLINTTEWCCATHNRIATTLPFTQYSIEPVTDGGFGGGGHLNLNGHDGDGAMVVGGNTACDGEVASGSFGDVGVGSVAVVVAVVEEVVFDETGASRFREGGLGFTTTWKLFMMSS